MDIDSGKDITTIPIGSGVDANAFDAESGLAFSSNGEGTLTVAHEWSPGKFDAKTVLTQKSARTMALDANTHKIYLPVAEFGPALAPTLEIPKPRPIMIKDSFGLLIVGK